MVSCQLEKTAPDSQGTKLITENWQLRTGVEMPSLHIRRNDVVKVLAGSDRGKTGRVLRVIPDKGKVLVEHVRVV